MDTRAGFVALIGAPNAGKSTLINQLIGMKLAIVTHKVQTTRTRLLGIAIHKRSQIIFVDTPGIFAPRKRFDRALVNAAWKGADDADFVALLIDASLGVTKEDEIILQKLEHYKRQAVLVINKVDLVKKEALLALSSSLNDRGLFSKIFMISALKGDGVDDLKDYIADNVEEGPWLYPEDQVTDVTQRQIAAEITREKIFLRLHQELPYAIWVESQTWEDKKDGSVRLEQVIHVERASQKGIVIGKQGRTLKIIGEEARLDMEQVFDCRVHLFLFVKVSENWNENRFHYNEMGLDFVE